MSFEFRRIGWLRLGGLRLAGLRPRGLALLLTGFCLSACATNVAQTPRWNHPVREVTETALSSPTLARLHVRGIDVSYYQGDIDWSTVRESGVTFAYIKATEGGDYLDSKFHQNWVEAKEAGIRRGAYHFYNLCRPVRDQIAWFEHHVPRDPDALPPAVDMEWVPTSKTCRGKPPRAEVIADLQLFLDHVERHYGKRPVIYATASFHHDILEGAFNDYPFWLRAIDGPPGERYAFRPWHFWQYSARGTIPGVRGHIDKNAFAGTHADWAAFVDGET